MAQTFAQSAKIQKNFSTNLTSRSYSSTKSLNDIKYEKRIYQRYYSSKSLKSIQKQYQKIDPNQETIMKIQFIKNNAVQKVQSLQNNKFLQALPINILLRQKFINLTHSLFMDLQIYKKFQSSVKRQKTILSKLYGWDRRFETIFFKGQEIMNQVDKQKVQRMFFGGKSGRYDSQSKSIYNKMRLFQAELRNFNTKQMNLNFYLKGKSLRQSLDKFANKINLLQNPEKGRSQIALKVKEYSPSKKKKSLVRIMGMKQGMEDDDYRIDNFELWKGQNFDTLETIVENGYMSCRTQL